MLDQPVHHIVAGSNCCKLGAVERRRCSTRRTLLGLKKRLQKVADVPETVNLGLSILQMEIGSKVLVD